MPTFFDRNTPRHPTALTVRSEPHAHRCTYCGSIHGPLCATVRRAIAAVLPKEVE